MQHRVLSSADVEIDHPWRGIGILPMGHGLEAHATPIFCRFFADETVIVLWIAKAQVVPARARPLRHHIGFARRDRKSTRLNSSHSQISYAVFCLKKKKHI